MTTPKIPNSTSTTNLRRRAQAVLKPHPPHPSAVMDSSLALRVLFDLASSPATAHDALALLHELQVHQVELDLQNEELQNARTELETAWSRQVQLLDASPGAQLVLDTANRVVECNARAMQYLQQPSTRVLGARLQNWLDAADQIRVQTWLLQAQQSNEPISLGFVLFFSDTNQQSVFASACMNPLSPGSLVSWVPAPA